VSFIICEKIQNLSIFIFDAQDFSFFGTFLVRTSSKNIYFTQLHRFTENPIENGEESADEYHHNERRQSKARQDDNECVEELPLFDEIRGSNRPYPIDSSSIK
jgi:hypothetical protein